MQKTKTEFQIHVAELNYSIKLLNATERRFTQMRIFYFLI